ncbi:unnamed protein product [Parnassius mnemosyne]|uniref:C2H2-type domain-containing protein n=1 Tax=Parnassius mnemosyne TaxID=213953 RepID=A0AAV1KFG6_9NEOP
MTSDDSDDEPLSVLAAAKKLNPEKFVEPVAEDSSEVPRKRKRKSLTPKKLGITININRKQRTLNPPPVIERPADVWLYLKDLNPSGPYSCLLCPDWFINRSKMILHYVLNHKKDFCGICRYFVPDREAWYEHVKFHVPWPCSQCVANFPNQITLRHHLSAVHKLVHCRLCHFRVTDDDQYNTHLFQKHNVTNVLSKDEEVLWDFDYEGTTQFLCLLCSKSNNLISTFFKHYMGYHHFTIKCLTSIISGRDPPFTINGADVSSHFIDGQLQGQIRYGYVDLGKRPFEILHASKDGNNAYSYLKAEIKVETKKDTDNNKEDDTKKDGKIKYENIHKNYKGDEDFDVTLTELIVLEKCYFDYVTRTLNDINCNQMPENSVIPYEDGKSDIIMDVDCPLCKSKYENAQAFTMHMNKMHCVKLVPLYSCRVCATTFDTQSELDTHTSMELGDFDDLWICQFCDKEFDNREATRKHLTEHWDIMEYDNCFSPHLGFKCKYCPTLFWNETDREQHQVRTHFINYTDQFYKCESCSETFSDKVWFIHHHLEKHFEDKITTYLLKCCLCCIILPNVEAMRNHFQDEHPEAQKVYCSLDSCQYKPLSHRKSFKLHVKTVHNPSVRAKKAVNCTVCGRDFNTSRACAAHVAQVHGPGKFKCKLCRDVLHTIDERKLHYLLRHPGRHPYECSECGKSFQYKSSLYMHRQDHFPNKQSFTCNYCGKVFRKKDSYREHVQIHEGPRHACSYCPMRFVQRSNMLRHERRHTGERPYACPHCPRTFADKGACNSHVRTHSKETSFACVYCGQTFVQKSKLTYHIRKHTGENLETCPVCSKLFTSACALREHMKIHVAKKQLVKCPLCEKRYQDERYMLRHLRTTHTGSQHACPLCHKLLTSAPGLRHHLLTHSATNLFHCKCCKKSYAIKRTMIKHLRRRHGLKGTEINIKDFFKKLDPRECQLGLDEETMTSIFGPPKKIMTDILIGDYVTITNNFNSNKRGNQITEGDGEDEQSAEEIECKYNIENSNESNADETNKEIENVCIKQEPMTTEVELEPTDFVSVKIEPYDENDSS